MRIGFDAHVFDGRDQGTKTLMLRVIGEAAAAFPEHEILVYSERPHPELDFGRANLHFRPTVRRSAFRHLLRTMPRAARADTLDVMVFNYVAPPTLRRSAIMIHDVLPQTYPSLFPLKFVAQCWGLFGASSMLARRIFTISDYSRAEIRRIYPWTRRRTIDVLHIGPSFTAATYAQAGRPPDRWGPLGRYVLGVGRIEPRKNVQMLIDAFRAGAPAGAKLVLVGSREPGTTIDPGGDPRIVMLSGVSDADLASLYRGADLFVYPSMAEGFGLPLLDAILFGVPVISSNQTSMLEVGRSCAAFFDPTDPDALAWLTRRIASHFDGSPVPAPSADQRRERAACYSWRNAARELVDGLSEGNGLVTRDAAR